MPAASIHAAGDVGWGLLCEAKPHGLQAGRTVGRLVLWVNADSAMGFLGPSAFFGLPNHPRFARRVDLGVVRTRQARVFRPGMIAAAFLPRSLEMALMSSPADSPASRQAMTGVGAPPTPEAWAAAHATALPYEAFLATHATAEQRRRWEAFHAQVSLTASQRQLLGGFTRTMPVIVLAGAWCGDCVNQCPIFEHFAAASPSIDLRFLDREALPGVAAHLRVCGGQRVPVVAFFSEDFTPILVYGDRTLSAYRAAVASQLGSACASGAVSPPADAIAAVVGDWLDQFERVHHILRLSARLRQKHGD